MKGQVVIALLIGLVCTMGAHYWAYDAGRHDQAAADSATMVPVPSRYVFLPPHVDHAHVDVWIDSVSVRWPDGVRNAYAYCDTVIYHRVIMSPEGR